MPTFVLKKYQETPVKSETPEETPNQNEETTDKDPESKPVEKELLVEVSGSVSEIVATALNKVFANKGVTVEESDEEKEVNAGVISTEDIENDPVKALRSAKSSNAVLIVSEGFTTKKEEYFLTNMEDYQGKVFYSVESFIDYLACEMTNDPDN